MAESGCVTNSATAEMIGHIDRPRDWRRDPDNRFRFNASIPPA